MLPQGEGCLGYPRPYNCALSRGSRRRLLIHSWAKRHQNTQNSVKYEVIWKHQIILPLKYEVPIKQYLRSILVMGEFQLVWFICYLLRTSMNFVRLAAWLSRCKMRWAYKARFFAKFSWVPKTQHHVVHEERAHDYQVVTFPILSFPSLS